MKSFTEIPEGYVQSDYVNLYANRSLYRSINLLSLLIGLALFLLGWRWRGLDALQDLLRKSLADYYLWMALLLVLMLVYLTLHELTHGFFIRRFSGLRPHYGKKGLLLFVGSGAYFCRKHYLMIALAPVVLWGIVFGILSAFLQGKWFWLVYGLQIANFGGAAGDAYMTYKALRGEKVALYQDSGVSVAIYTKTEAV